MSGEYFCIEEVRRDTSPYYEGYPSNESPRDGSKDCVGVRDNRDDARSDVSKKTQDLRLYEIEEQLEIAETRCNKLKGQLDCMKKIYSKNERPNGVHQLGGTQPNLICPDAKGDGNVPCRKRHNSGTRVRSQQDTLKEARSISPNLLRRHHTDICHDSTDTILQNSSSSSTAAHKGTVLPSNKDRFVSHLVRQNPHSIETDHTGAAVMTINNILSGITNSVNRLSQLHAHDTKMQANEVTGVVFSGDNKSFSPRLQKRLLDQQTKLQKLVQHDENVDTLTEMVASRKTQLGEKPKSKVKSTWGRRSSNKLQMPKSKFQTSSGSVNFKKTIKSTARAVENTTKIHSVRTGMLHDDSQSLIINRKRKRSSVKRLKSCSKRTLARKFSDQITNKYEHNADTNLVELYHNIAAKTSDSDDSNINGKTSNINNTNNKTNSHTKTNRNYSSQSKKQKEGHVTATAHTPSFHFYTDPIKPPPVKPINANPRVLTPINENGYIEQSEMIHNDFYMKNYELPTIASKMKQVSKCYLESFNFRSIPFCAAKSTSPSHNIGINIQQVMSIIKTRQPITGISPTLAHNISLAAGRLQDHPFSNMVSALSTRMGYNSQCPLSKSAVDYSQLNEMSKVTPAELNGEKYSYNGHQSEIFVNGASGDREALKTTTSWTQDPTSKKYGACTPEKGISFHQVLNRFQASNSTIGPRGKSSISQRSGIGHHSKRVPFRYNHLRRQRTKHWINSDIKSFDNVNQDVIDASKPEESSNNIQSKEKSLKTVLKNLHDEFDFLNTNYEKLANEINKSNENEALNSEMMKQLEEMEQALNKKEEEINMVMSLYTEVVALKDQVKKLKERTSSQQSINQMTQKTPSKLYESQEPKAVLHLTQLLRQIQNYQMHWKVKA